jgi:SAM-dependent methyltransferase
MTAIDEAKLQETSLGGFGLINGLAASLGAHYGMKAGLFEALRDHGPATSEALAKATGFNERWLREWLYQQAAAGTIDHENGEIFSLSPEGVLVFADSSTAASLVGMFEGLPSLVDSLSHIPQALQTGLGRPYDAHGDDGAAMIEGAFRGTVTLLVEQALPALDGATEDLAAGGHAADVGCGAGLRTLAMAEAYPKSTWTGYDNSVHALARAANNLAQAALDNCRFVNAEQTPLPADHSLSLVTFCDVVHDMAFPQDALNAVYGALKPDGRCLVIDIAQPESIAERLEHPAAPAMYGFSLGVCMSSGLSEEGGAGLGTFGLPASKLEAMAQEAGFTRFRITDVEDPFNAYYELRP